MRLKGGATNTERVSGSAKGKSPGNGQTTLSQEEIKHMIAEAAYLRAAQRGFAPGGEIGDWLEAEREVLGALQVCPLTRRPDGAILGQELQHQGVLVETPPADATAR